MKQITLRSKKSKETLIQKGKRVPCVEVNMDDFTAIINYRDSYILLFLTKVYSSRYLLGYWSHSPCGTTRDQEQGWMLIDYDKMVVVDDLETRTMGRQTGEYRDWYKNIGTQYGKAKYLVDKYGDRPWKITEIN